jgi:hypothetical protein
VKYFVLAISSSGSYSINISHGIISDKQTSIWTDGRTGALANTISLSILEACKEIYPLVVRILPVYSFFGSRVSA